MTSEKYLASWQKCLIYKSSTIKDALLAITASGGLMACMVNDSKQLLGILTDSDIRKALLQGGDIEDLAEIWLQTSPITARDTLETAELLAIAEENSIREIPLIDHKGALSDIFVLLVHQHRIESRPSLKTVKDQNKSKLPNYMLILAGGLGTRLRSVVSDRPKPLALVGGKPILETLIMHGVSCGITNFYISLNYMADAIIDHLKAAQYADLNIKILRETERLGTAGSISLIRDEIAHPLLVANADILTTVPFDKVLKHHLKENADISCTVRINTTVVPFGVVQIQDGEIVSVLEKPKFINHVNTGIYVLKPDICKLIERDKYLDMPTLIDTALIKKRKVVPFLLHEYWKDIGQPEDFFQANIDYEKHFGDQSEY